MSKTMIRKCTADGLVEVPLRLSKVERRQMGLLGSTSAQQSTDQRRRKARRKAEREARRRNRKG